MRYGWPARGMKVIAITGTNGKTTTAAFIGKILEQAGYTVGISTTAFFQVGKEFELNDTNMTVTNPFALQKLLKRMRQAKVDWVILETTSHALLQHRTLGVPVTAAVMTNLTQDHLDYHGSMDRYAAAKARLFARSHKYSVLNQDDEWFHYFEKIDRAKQRLTYGTDKGADCRIIKAELKPSGSELTIKYEHTRLQVRVNLIGKFNAYNALSAACTAFALGIDPEAVSSGLEQLEGVPGRMETITTNKGFKIVIDYAHTADALENVLESLRHVTKGKLIAVFGATGDRDKTKRPIMGKTVARLSDIAIVTDDDPYSENPINIRAEVLRGVESVVDGAEVYEIADRRGAIQKAIGLAGQGDTILLAGIGHQKYRVIDGKKEEWSERGVAEELLAKA